MKKILYCILLMFLCSILSCDRKRQSSEQDMKDSLAAANFMKLQSPNQKIPDRKTKCVIKTHINIKQNVIFGAKLKPV